jgi:hypothetical protein
LRSDQGNRDRYIRTRMFPNDRTAAFTVSVPAPPAREALQNGETVSGTIEGVLEIDGRATPLTLDGEARYEAGKLYLLGRGSFTWQELGIPPPNVSGIVQVEDTVSFEVLILAVPQ